MIAGFSIRTKAYILTGLFIVLLVIALVVLYNQNNNIKNEIKINESEKVLEDIKTNVNAKKDSLEQSVMIHDSIIQSKVAEINKIVNSTKKPKRIVYEQIKIKDTNYIVMRKVLDTVQPNK